MHFLDRPQRAAANPFINQAPTFFAVSLVAHLRRDFVFLGRQPQLPRFLNSSMCIPPMPPVPIKASRSLSLLEEVAVSAFSAGSAPRRIAGAANAAAAALPAIVFTKDRRDVELPEKAIVSSPWELSDCDVSATDRIIKS